VLNLGPVPDLYFTERRLRQIATVKDKHEQMNKFSELVRNMQYESMKL